MNFSFFKKKVAEPVDSQPRPSTEGKLSSQLESEMALPEGPPSRRRPTLIAATPTSAHSSAPASPRRAAPASAQADFAETEVVGLSARSIGDILRITANLSADQVAQVLAYQQKHKLRFGEAAVKLGVVKSDDVMWALAQQFDYSYSPEANAHLNDELVVAKHPFSDAAEMFRSIRSQLMMNVLAADDKRRALCVVSPTVGDGKTYFAANLAIAFSQLGGRTLLVDADMRTPRLHTLFGMDNTSGLSTILSGRSQPSIRRPIKELRGLYLLPVGAVPPNPLELAARAALPLLINELLHKFDHVIVDTPAAQHGADARVLAARCGAAVAIGHQNKSRIDTLQTLVTQLTNGSTRFAGVVMNEF